jgi:hypothetical protein
MMADHDNLDAVELASAYLDGEATADERARVEGDPALLAEVDRLRRVHDAVAVVSPASPAQRDAAIAAALSAFDELRVDAPSPPNVVSIAGRRRARLMQVLTAAAAAAVLVLGGFIIANRGGDDDSADEVRRADATAPGGVAAPSVTTAPGGVAAPSSTTATELEAAEEPLVAAPNDVATAELATTAVVTMAMATTEFAMDAAAAPAAEAPPVLDGADQLRSFAESLDDAPPPLDDVVADCQAGPRPSPPEAVFEDEDGTVTEVAVASTADGYAAVSLDDCAIVLRSPSAADVAEG